MGSRKLMNSMIEYSKNADYPLLLIYGEKDNIVDKRGCDLIFEAWRCKNKQFVVIENGTHGKSTVVLAKSAITRWLHD
jgi:alpha-beta hydrolase superfamily lysophospholipase